ncbi:unnamed protein product [Boreogadus saida]
MLDSPPTLSVLFCRCRAVTTPQLSLPRASNCSTTTSSSTASYSSSPPPPPPCSAAALHPAGGRRCHDTASLFTLQPPERAGGG